MKCLLVDIDDTLYKHTVNPQFLDYDAIYEDKQLKYLLNKIKLPKYIYTNAMFIHANKILNRYNIVTNFDKIYSRDTIPSRKPMINSAISVENDIKFNDNNITSIIFFDDLLENLETGKERGWVTVWIHPEFKTNNNYNFIDYGFPNFKTALKTLFNI